MSHRSIETEILRSKLLDTYHDTSMEDFFKGEVIETNQGSCYRINHQRRLKLNTLAKDKARDHMIKDLKLIRGIGDSKAGKLRSEGFKTIQDLQDHPTYNEDACKIMELMDEGEFSSLSEYVTGRYSKSHPSALYSTCFLGSEKYLFLDIETLGLKNVPLILIGVASVEDNKIIVDQYLLRDLNEEKAALEAFLTHIKDETVFVSFNGQTFDIPYIRGRMAYHKICNNLSNPHIDLLHFSRRRWKQELPNCRLQTLEKHLFDMERVDDVPSSMVPSFYKTYHETGNIGPLIPIVEHNREDVVTLARILSRLHIELDE